MSVLVPFEYILLDNNRLPFAPRALSIFFGILGNSTERFGLLKSSSDKSLMSSTFSVISLPSASIGFPCLSIFGLPTFSSAFCLAIRSSSAFLSASTRASSSVFSVAILSVSFFSASMRAFSSFSARSRSSAAFLSASALAASSLRAFSPTSVPLPPSTSSQRLEKIPMRKGRPNTLSDRPFRKSSVKAYCYT